MEQKDRKYSEFSHSALPHINDLYNFALRITGNKRKAGNLLKDTYKKAYWFYEWLEKDTDIYHWLFRVMRNAYINLYGNKSKYPGQHGYEESEKLYEGIKISLMDVFDNEKYNSLTSHKLSKALSSLPEDFRIVIILTDIIGFNYEQTSDFVDVPVGVVRSRIYKGREMLFTKIYPELINS